LQNISEMKGKTGIPESSSCNLPLFVVNVDFSTVYFFSLNFARDTISSSLNCKLTFYFYLSNEHNHSCLSSFHFVTSIHSQYSEEIISFGLNSGKSIHKLPAFLFPTFGFIVPRYLNHIVRILASKKLVQILFVATLRKNIMVVICYLQTRTPLYHLGGDFFQMSVNPLVLCLALCATFQTNR
jgi:hypothetical protein